MFGVFMYMLLSIFLMVGGLIGIVFIYCEMIKLLKHITNRRDISNNYDCTKMKVDFLCNSIISFLFGCIFIYFFIMYL